MTSNQGTALVFAVVVAACVFMLYIAARPRYSPSTITVTPKKQRSWAARQLMTEFNALPEDHRPSIDINAVVDALDTKHTVSVANSHFKTAYGYSESSQPSWDHHGCRAPCPLDDYLALHRHMKAVTNAYQNRERALEVAAQQHGFEQMKQLIDSLVSETTLLDENTADIEEGSRNAD